MLAQIRAVALRRGVRRRQQLAKALQSRAQDKLPKRQQDDRYDEWRNIIEQAEQQHPREQFFLVHLPQADQHRGVEHTEAAGRMAGEAKQRCRNENNRDNDEAEVRLVRHQHIHRQRAKAEIDNADGNLQQGQRPPGQDHRPWSAADNSWFGPDPGHIGRKADDDADRDQAVEPGRQLIDVGRRLRVINDAQPQHRGVAEPERQAGQKADLGHIDRIQSPRRIDAIAHRAAGKDAGADIVTDRVAGEGRERGHPVGNIGAADGADREQVIKRQREIACGDE